MGRGWGRGSSEATRGMGKRRVSPPKLYIRARTTPPATPGYLEAYRKTVYNYIFTLLAYFTAQNFVSQELKLFHSFSQWEGHLSLRMRIPGNMWAEVWQSARPVPVRRQKRLFDETKEAEKVTKTITCF